MQAGRDREMHFVKEKTEDFKPVAATTYQSVSEMTKGKFFRFFFFISRWESFLWIVLFFIFYHTHIDKTLKDSNQRILEKFVALPAKIWG